MNSSTLAPRRRLPVRRRILFVAVWMLVMSATAWAAWRIVLQLRADVPLTGATTERDVWTFYYPQLKFSGTLTDTDDDQYFDIVFLGGSVLEQVADAMTTEDLQRLATTGQPIRFYNLAKSAHTTRDSLLKMRLLRHRQLDLVIVYHGINDARMNCCAAADFKDDYTHCDWYSGMKKRVAARRITFPNLVLDAALQLIPNGEPTPELAALGREIKTAPTFAANLSELIAIASGECHAQVVSLTFASYLPPDYSRDAFTNGKLGYADGDFRMPVESWGEPDAVRRAIAAHNDVQVQLAAERTDVKLIDLASEFADRKALFCDPCHLSPAGCAEFLARLFASVAGGAAHE